MSSRTTSTSLTDSECIKLNLKMIFNMSLTILLLCLFLSCFNSLFFPVRDYDISYDPVNIKNMGMCKCTGNKCLCKSLREEFNNISNEPFSNDSFYSFKLSRDARYQSIPLLDPKNNTILFGKAQRYIFSKNDQIVYRLDIDSNLYVLDGNIFDSEKVDQKYDVLLHNTKTNKDLHIGNLKKDGDGIYKLSFVSNNKVQELSEYDTLYIFYTMNNKSDLILSGTFN